MNPYDPTGEKGEQVRSMFDRVAHSYDRLNHLLSLGIDRSWRRRVAKMVAQELGAASGRQEQAGYGERDGRPGRTDVKPSAVEFAWTAEARRRKAEPEDRSPRLPQPNDTAPPSAALLDLATGTGDMAIALARRCPGAQITGVDLSEKMVEIGREKIARAGLSDRITLLVGSAEELPLAGAGGGQGERDGRLRRTVFSPRPAACAAQALAVPFSAPDNADGLPATGFDAATVAFGVRNFSDIALGLAQLNRALRKGGALYILEFSTPHIKFFGYLYHCYFHRVVPVIGGWLSGDRKAYDYLPASVDEFPAPDRFMETMRQAGFDRCSARRMFFGVAMIYKGIKI